MSAATFAIVVGLTAAGLVAWLAIRAFRSGRKLSAWIVIGSFAAIFACAAVAALSAAVFVFRPARIQGRGKYIVGRVIYRWWPIGTARSF